MRQPPQGTRIEVDAVSRRFGARLVLDRVAFEARPGAFVAIVGKSGCGKTTLLRILAGIDPPSSGAIRLASGVAAATPPKVRMIFQEPRLLPWRRLSDNVSVGLPRGSASAEAARRALARVGLGGRDGDWPAVLSGGEKQRVALARALVSAPGLLLLDEPLGALDALTRLEMQRLLEEIWLELGFTAVLVTHDVHEAVALADRVVSLEGGRIASSVAVDLPRPRDRASRAFTRLAEEVLTGIEGRPGAPVWLDRSASVI